MLPAERWIVKGRCNVRFGSKADMCDANRHVRFTPNSDRESGLPAKVMSALSPKADMCGATEDFRYGPKGYSCSAAKGIVIRSARRRGPETSAQLPAHARPKARTARDIRLLDLRKEIAQC